MDLKHGKYSNYEKKKKKKKFYLQISSPNSNSSFWYGISHDELEIQGPYPIVLSNGQST